MDLELTDEQLALRDTVRRCLTDRAPVTPYARQHAEGRRWSPDDAWSHLAALGATAVVVPETAGGLGLGLVDAAVVAEELGRGVYPGPWAASCIGAVRAVLAMAGPGPLATALAAGSTTATVVVPEPLGDALPPAFTADADGALTGEAGHVLSAPVVDQLLVAATGPDGLSLYAVATGAAGVDITPEPSVDVIQPVGHVALRGAPATRLGPASTEAMAMVAGDLLVAMAADALGAAQAVMELAVDYAKVRVQFGQPIGAFQSVQHLCVDMLETVELARGGVLHAAWAADAGTPEQRRVAALRLKAFADRLAHVADIAIQIFGGIGFTWEHDSHLYLKRLLTWSAFLGSPARYRQELGRHLATR